MYCAMCAKIMKSFASYVRQAVLTEYISDNQLYTANYKATKNVPYEIILANKHGKNKTRKIDHHSRPVQICNSQQLHDGDAPSVVVVTTNHN